MSALLPIATPAETRADVWARIRHRRGLAVVAAIVLVAAATAALVVPPLLGAIVDVAVERRPAGDVLAPALGLAGAALAQALLTIASGRLVARVGEEVLAELREEVVTRALAVPAVELERSGAGDLLSRVSGDVRLVSEAVRSAVPLAAQSALLAGLTIVGLVVLDWRLALAALVAMPIQVLAVRSYVRDVVPIYRRERIAEGARTQELVTTLAAAQTVRAIGLTASRAESVRARSADAVDVSLEGMRALAARMLPALNGAELAGLSAVLAVGYALVEADAATVGTATAAALYFHRAFDPVGALMFVFDDVLEATSSLSRLVGVTQLGAPAAGRAADRDGGAVRARGVTHSYVDGHPVLSDIDFDIAPGERVAVIGSTGAGKTTLARIVAGVQEATGGELHVGAHPVALVTQELRVFAGSLAADLRLAAPGASDEDLWDALDVVGAGEWARALPEGLATLVGEGGRRLNPTQAQQLALARLVLRDPQLAVLDEATAETGSAGAQELERAAAAATAGRTTLVVAHRLTQAATADRVVVLEHGRVVEQGTHEELLQREGRYRELWNAWDRAR